MTRGVISTAHLSSIVITAKLIAHSSKNSIHDDDSLVIRDENYECDVHDGPLGDVLSSCLVDNFRTGTLVVVVACRGRPWLLSISPVIRHTNGKESSQVKQRTHPYRQEVRCSQIISETESHHARRLICDMHAMHGLTRLHICFSSS